VILRAGERQRANAVAQTDETRFLAVEEFLDDDLAPGIAKRRTGQHAAHGRFGFIDGVGHHHRLVPAAVTDLQPVHQPVGDRLQLRCPAGLRDAGFAGGTAEIRVKSRNSDVGDATYSRPLKGVFLTPIDRELPDVDTPVSRHRGSEDCREKGRSPGRVVQISRQEPNFAIDKTGKSGKYHVRRSPTVHSFFVDRTEEGAKEEGQRWRRKKVRRHRD